MNRTDTKTLRRAHARTEARRRAPRAPHLPMGTPNCQWALQLWAAQMRGGATSIEKTGGRPYALKRRILFDDYYKPTQWVAHSWREGDLRDKKVYRHFLGLLRRQRGHGPRIPGVAVLK